MMVSIKLPHLLLTVAAPSPLCRQPMRHSGKEIASSLFKAMAARG